MADFKFFDNKPKEEEKMDEKFPAFEIAPTKKPDDSRLIQRGAKKKKRSKYEEFNPNKLPEKNVNYNNLFG